MARAESLAKGGFYAFPEDQLTNLTRLFLPAPAGARILDPCAGEGDACIALANALKLDPWAIELEYGRAATCVKRFPAGQALQSDMFNVELSAGSMQVAFVNPPFTWDTAVSGQRREAGMLAHSWQWLQTGGWMVFVSYIHHLTAPLIYHVASLASSIEVFRLKAKHFDTYTYTVLVAQKGKNTDSGALAKQVLDSLWLEDMLPLLETAQPTRRIPHPAPVKDLYFHRQSMSPDSLLSAVEQYGADRTTAWRVAVQPPPEEQEIRPPLRPKIGHLVTLIAGGMFNYLPMQTGHGRALLRSVIRYVEELASTETNEEGRNKKETYILRPRTTITLLHEDGHLEDISTDSALNAFIQTYKQQLFAYAERRFKPRYDMTGDSPEKRKWLPHMLRQRVKGKHRLFPAQMHVGAAICTTLEQINRCLFVGEMSTGKTATSLAIMDAWYREGRVKPGQVMWVNCPSHLVKKWAREASQQLPIARVTTLVLEDERGRRDMLEDLSIAMLRAEQVPQHLHIIIAAQDAIKLGEGWQPAYRRNIKQRLVCAVTGEPIQHVLEGLRIDADEDDLKERQFFSPDRRHAYWQEIRKYNLPKGKSKGSKNPRGPVWRLFKKRYRGRIAISFFDEVQGSKDIATDRYRSMSVIARASDNIVALTGTIFNGYASSLYGPETVFNPSLFERYAWGNVGINAFVRDMGVLERVVEYRDEFNKNGTYTGVKRINHGVKERPGASPLLIQMLLDHTVFLSLSDIGKALPKLEETPVSIDMDTMQGDAYKTGMNILKGHLMDRRSLGDSSFLAAYFRSSLAYPDTATTALPVIHNLIDRSRSGQIIRETPLHVHTFPALALAQLPKESWLIGLVKREMAEGRGVAVFVTQTDKRDYQPRLLKLLQDHAGASPVILYSDTVKPIDREEWIEKQFASGRNTLICNPRLVETGLDLLMCPTLIFYEPEYQLSVLAQAARRHWRIPQTKDCRTFYVYYRDSMQEKAMTLITEKLKSLSVVNGESASLSALNQLGDILKELMNGDVEVKDLRSEFASINQRDYHDAEWENAMLPEPVEMQAALPGVLPVPEKLLTDAPVRTNQLPLF